MSSRPCAMRSPVRPDTLRRSATLAAAVAATWAAAPAWAADAADAATPAPLVTAPLTRDEVDAQARRLADGPGLRGSKVERHLRLKFDEQPAPRRRDEAPAWLQWLGDFAEWLNSSGRFLVWLAMAGIAAYAALRLHRWLRGREAPLPQALSLPTHVRELDIRPETLPEDVGAAALALWQAGDARAAMSLLYRGALSALVHRHAVPIRASSTEGDCLALARPRLAGAAQQYLEALVGAWRQTVYAARPPADDAAQALCRGFGACFAPGAAGA